MAFDFTGVADGVWGNRTITFDPAAAGIDAANLRYLTLSITAQTHNHDQYVATDVGPVPEPGPAVLLAMGSAILLLRRRCRALSRQ